MSALDALLRRRSTISVSSTAGFVRGTTLQIDGEGLLRVVRNADVRNILAQGYLPEGLPTAYPASVCEASK